MTGVVQWTLYKVKLLLNLMRYTIKCCTSGNKEISAFR